MKSFSLSLFLLWAPVFSALAQLATQPMVGHVGLRDARIWLQSEVPGDMSIECWPSDASPTPSTLIRSTTREARPQSGHTAIVEVGGLLPGTLYRFRVLMDGSPVTAGFEEEWLSFTTQPLWQYRSDPPEFTVAIGSCSYINEPAFDRPGKSYGGGYEIFQTIADQSPDLMLWLGDNVYFREVDWGSRSGMVHRYSHLRALPEMQALLGCCPHYAIWDDHDFGPNDADGSWIHKDWAAQTFADFWPNPSQGLPDLDGQGITTAFSFMDIDFFLLDNRTFRVNPDNQSREPQALGKAQIDWLMSALQFSKAPFKVVALGGQMLSDYAMYENMAQFPAERTSILERIEAEGIEGVVFLSGDRHSSELSALTLDNGHAILDFTCSALTSGTYDHSAEPNHNRVEGTSVGVRNYGTLTFRGERTAREMILRTFDAAGNLLWERSCSSDDLNGVNGR